MDADHISLPTTSNVRGLSKGRKAIAMKDGEPVLIDWKGVQTPLAPTASLIDTSITSLTGGANPLTSVATVALPVGTVIGVVIAGTLSWFQLVTSTLQTVGYVRPTDFNNNKTWKSIG